MNVLTLVALFGAGVSSVLAPCVLPLLPAYVTVMIDAASRGAGAAVVRSGLEFVAGFTAVFVGLGAATGALGAAAGTVGATADLLARVGGGVLVGMALLMLLAGRTRTGAVHRLLKRMPQAGSRWRPLLLGVGFGAAWTPCVGPLLGSALVIAAGSGPAAGAVLLTAYSLGLAVPLLCLCLAVQAGSVPLRGLAARFGQAALAWHRVAACLVLVLGAALASGRTPCWSRPWPAADGTAARRCWNRSTEGMTCDDPSPAPAARAGRLRLGPDRLRRLEFRGCRRAGCAAGQ